MRVSRDTSDVLASCTAVLTDGVAVFCGYLLATWIRFDSGLLAVPLGRMPNLYHAYAPVLALATVATLFVYQWLGLYRRPQTGVFSARIPRIVRGTLLSILLTMGMAFLAKNTVEVSSKAVFLAAPAVALLVILERWALFRLEIRQARHSERKREILILGANAVAQRLRLAFEREPRLRCRVAGFVRLDTEPPAEGIGESEVLGHLDELPALLAQRPIHRVVLTQSDIGHSRIVSIILLCERNLATFSMVPDLFTVMTRSVDVQAVDDIPLLGVGRWPLDFFWNRVLKRLEDVVGAVVGLVIAAPVIAVVAILVKRSSPGPVFYRQDRCGEAGHPFTLYKLRTMPVDAEAQTGPVWAVENDPRRTRIGAFLRQHNLDELPQLWNVLTGRMSLVGPRPERPHFVEKFREDIERYMWRHVSKPGMTGWAQVNGLRGNTSIEERVKYDLYYLENWSLAFDFKILVRTFFTRENAY